MRLDFSIVSLPGNPINLTNYITLQPSEVYYTASNWSTEVVLLVDGTSESPVFSVPSKRNGMRSRMLHVVGLLYVQIMESGLLRTWATSRNEAGPSMQSTACVPMVHIDKLGILAEHGCVCTHAIAELTCVFVMCRA